MHNQTCLFTGNCEEEKTFQFDSSNSTSSSYIWLGILLGILVLLFVAMIYAVSKQTKRFVIDRETGELVEEIIPRYVNTAMKLTYSNVIGRKIATKSVSLLRKMSVEAGKRFDLSSSTTQIEPFIKLYKLNPDEFEKSVNEYKNFNEFFTRKFKNFNSVRPLEGDENYAVCPADCRMTVFPKFEDSLMWVKGAEFTIEKLLGPKAAQSYDLDKFKGGTLVISRLTPQDYHRWHNPIQGIYGEKYEIGGALYTVNPLAINERFNVYTENKRTVCVIKSEHFGVVFLVAIAATFVGSMEIIGKENEECAIGEYHGKFYFGGSTVILLFQPNTIKLEDDLVYNTIERKKETLVKVRSVLGKSIKNYTKPLNTRLNLKKTERIKNNCGCR